MYDNLLELAEHCPNLNITLSAKEMIEAINYCVDKTITDLNMKVSDEESDSLLSQEQVCEILKISKQTLWRWRAAGYITSINIGGRVCVSQREVDRVLGGLRGITIQ